MLKKVGYPTDMNIHINKETGRPKVQFYRLGSIKSHRNDGKLLFKFADALILAMAAPKIQGVPMYCIIMLAFIFFFNSHFHEGQPTVLMYAILFCTFAGSVTIFSMAVFLPISCMAVTGNNACSEIMVCSTLIGRMMNGHHWKVKRQLLFGMKADYSIPLKSYFWVDYEATGSWMDYKKIMIVSRIRKMRLWKLKYTTREWFFKVIYDAAVPRTGQFSVTYA